MSLIDSKLEFSDNQDVKASAISTNVLDFANTAYKNLGFVWWNILITTAVVGTTAVRASLITKATEPSANDGTILAEIYIPQGTAIGAGFSICVPLQLVLRWVGVWYEDVGTDISAANVDSWLGMEPINPQRNFQNEPS